MADISGITLGDLQAEQVPNLDEVLLSFSVLTYTIETDALESLEYVVDSLSQSGIRYDNIDAFEANGFSIGFTSHEQGAGVLQKLQSIGAVRSSLNIMQIPARSNEILFSTSVSKSGAIIFSTSGTGGGAAPVTPGKLGWIISAQSDSSVEPAAEIMLCPAFWKLGASDLRLMSGLDPYQYEFFDVARVRLSLKAGQFIILAPVRAVKEQDTLDRWLFEVPGKDKMRFFVILYRGGQQIESK